MANMKINELMGNRSNISPTQTQVGNKPAVQVKP